MAGLRLIYKHSLERIRRRTLSCAHLLLIYKFHSDAKNTTLFITPFCLRLLGFSFS
jgi:hypothetical protein